MRLQRAAVAAGRGKAAAGSAQRKCPRQPAGAAPSSPPAPALACPSPSPRASPRRVRALLSGCAHRRGHNGGECLRSCTIAERARPSGSLNSATTVPVTVRLQQPADPFLAVCSHVRDKCVRACVRVCVSKGRRDGGVACQQSKGEAGVRSNLQESEAPPTHAHLAVALDTGNPFLQAMPKIASPRESNRSEEAYSPSCHCILCRSSRPVERESQFPIRAKKKAKIKETSLPNVEKCLQIARRINITRHHPSVRVTCPAHSRPSHAMPSPSPDPCVRESVQRKQGNQNTHDRRNAQQKETVKGSLATLC